VFRKYISLISSFFEGNINEKKHILGHLVTVMKHMHFSEVNLEQPDEPGVKNIKVRWLISKKDGVKNFAMRLFEIKPGGNSPLHQHDWEHEVFILEGNGFIKDQTKEEPLNPGDFLLIKPMEWHQIVNRGSSTLKFLCLIPYKQ
jgi:quercetin dioxygenase-like cupin family protein